MRWIFALLLLSANVAAAQSPASSQETILVDRDMSPAAGATVTIAFGRLVAEVEDRFVPLRLFEDRGRVRRTANRLYRVAKLYFFDDPQEDWLRVVDHEVFGHGGRLRELFNTPITYSLPAPPPYGRGGGATSFGFNRPPTLEEAQAVNVGGMEATQMMARGLAEDALSTGRWQYRDAIRYFYAEADTIFYILQTNDHEQAGQDVGDFLTAYDDAATEDNQKTLNARTLRRRELVSFANPMIGYSLYGALVSYVRNGQETAPVPMLHIGATRYLPMARFELTPFGTEWVIDNAITRNGRFLDATVRAGETIGARTWGIGVQTVRLAEWKQWTLGGEGDVWHQPEWGGEVMATADRRVGSVSWLRGPLSLVVQGGYKTNGFLAGERIHEGAVLRAGLSVTK